VIPRLVTTAAHLEHIAPAPMCPEHRVPMQVRRGKSGEFFGCPHYPACRATFPVGLPGIFCPLCSSPIVERIAKKSGKPFWPCSGRECRFVSWKKPHTCAHGEACWDADAVAMAQAPQQRPRPVVMATAETHVGDLDQDGRPVPF
jgi:ssDNA-binding Zn-finger/Zn-ribbon topoisomerase 1